MAVPITDDMVIEVSDDDTSYSVLNDLTDYTINFARNKTDDLVLQRSIAYSTFGPDTPDISFNGLLNVDDTGQELVRTAAQGNARLWLKVLWDGTNGFKLPCKVGARNYTGAPANREKVSFQFGADGEAPTEIGTGPLP